MAITQTQKGALALKASGQSYSDAYDNIYGGSVSVESAEDLVTSYAQYIDPNLVAQDVAQIDAYLQTTGGKVSPNDPFFQKYMKAPDSSAAAPAGDSPLFATTDVTTEMKTPADVGLATFGADVDSTTKLVEDTLAQMTKANEPLMLGKLPGDVTAAVRQGSAERALSTGQGSGSQAAKYVTARDLGRVSLDLIQQGIKNAESIAGLGQSWVSFQKTYDLNVATYLNAVRATDLSEKQLEEQQAEFNASQVLAVNTLYADIAKYSSQLAFEYTANKLQGDASYADPFTSSFQTLLDSLSTLATPPA